MQLYTEAPTLEFRAIVRKALDAAGISYSSGYTDTPPDKHGQHNGNIRYVAIELSYGYSPTDGTALREAVRAANMELASRGYSTHATAINGRIRGRCVISN